MNRRVLNITAGIMLIAACAFAAEAAITGNNYMKMPKRQRVSTVSGLISGAKTGGVTVKKTPVFYCKALDAFYAKHTNMTKQPLAIVLKTLIIMEYDWSEKGVDKDVLAKQWLGDASYKANRNRLGMK